MVLASTAVLEWCFVGAAFGPVTVDENDRAFLGSVDPTDFFAEITTVGMIC